MLAPLLVFSPPAAISWRRALAWVSWKSPLFNLHFTFVVTDKVIQQEKLTKGVALILIN